MMYVDTSVIIAALDPGDSRRLAARLLLEGFEPGVVSELVVAELAGVLSRRQELLPRPLAAARPEARIAAAVAYVMRRFRLRYRPCCGVAASLPGVGEAPLPVAVAVRAAAVARLRSLDLLHAACAVALRRMGEPVDSLVTFDRDFERARGLLEAEGVKVRVLS